MTDTEKHKRSWGIRGLCRRRSTAGEGVDLYRVRRTLKGAGQVGAPRGLDHGTEPPCGDLSSGPTTTTT